MQRLVVEPRREQCLKKTPVGHFVDRLIFESQRTFDAGHVVRRRVNQDVDVFGSAGTAAGDNGEAADQGVAGAGVVQRLTDAGEIFDLRLACVRAIVRVIHASASSKDVDRYTPRGMMAAVPRTAASVRWSAPTSSPSSRLRPTVL